MQLNKKKLTLIILTLCIGMVFTLNKIKNLDIKNLFFYNQKLTTVATPSGTHFYATTTNYTTPAFDPSLPHISSTTNIIDMFGITKDMKAKITKDVVVDWIIHDEIATQTLAKLTIKVPEEEIPGSQERKNYGELEFGKYILKWLNYYLDTGEEFETYNGKYHTGILVAYDNENKNTKIISNQIEPNNGLRSTGIYNIETSKKGNYISYLKGCWEYCYNYILDKDMKVSYRSITNSASNLTESDIKNTFYVTDHSYGLGSLDSIFMISKVNNNYMEREIFSIFNMENLEKIKSAEVKILKYENGKLFFEKHNFTWVIDYYKGEDRSRYDYNKISSIEKYYYDEMADKVVKINK